MKVRARQRARHALAMRHHDEYDWLVYLIEAEVGNSVAYDTIKARAMQIIVTGHRAEFRALQEAQEEREGVVALPRGSKRRHPHGTAGAWRYHQCHGEPPCEPCQQWHYEHWKRTCRVCEREFSHEGRGGMRTFCGPDCRRLGWYLDYWVKNASRSRTRKRMPAPRARERAARLGLDLDVLIARAENRALLAA
jgi:hypothetical protein